MRITPLSDWSAEKVKAREFELRQAMETAEKEAKCQGGGRGWAKAADYRAMSARKAWVDFVNENHL